MAPDERVSGPILRKLAERLPKHVQALAPEYWNPTAEAVGRLGDPAVCGGASRRLVATCSEVLASGSGGGEVAGEEEGGLGIREQGEGVAGGG